MLEEKTTARQRQWIYRLGAAGITLLVAYKVIAPEHAPLWLDLLVNVVGIGTPGVATVTATAVIDKQRKDGIIE